MDYLTKFVVVIALIFVAADSFLAAFSDRLPAFIVLNGPSAGDARDVARHAAPGDIAFGGDAKKLAAIADRLRASAATPDEPALYNKRLHIAMVYGLAKPGPTAPAPKVVVDLGQAGDAAVLIISEGPAIWRLENASRDQRAKIGIEGPSAFDIENGPPHILAGFRSGAFGVEDVTSPRDYVANAERQKKSRLCSAVKRWLKLFDASPGSTRFFIFNQPARIGVSESGLSGNPSAQSGFTWTAANECHDYFGPEEHQR